MNHTVITRAKEKRNREKRGTKTSRLLWNMSEYEEKGVWPAAREAVPISADGKGPVHKAQF